MEQIESRLLRYFVAVAEELSFARAAERLGIAAPALSRAIAQLETKVGVQLLERTTRAVTLTPAGAVLLDEVPGALDAVDAAIRHARRTGEPQRRLILTLKADHDGGLLDDLLAAYEREHPAVPCEVEFSGWGRQAGLLRDGRADVALLPTPADADDAIDFEIVSSEPRVAALAAGHPLASRTELRLADLQAEHDPVVADTVWQVRHAGGAPPAFEDFPALLRYVELGRLVALLPASVAGRYDRPAVVFRPVEDAPAATLAVAWPRGSRSLAVAALVRAATRALAARGEPAGRATG